MGIEKRTVYSASCDDCGLAFNSWGENDFDYKDDLKKEMLNEGWVTNGDIAYCPKCYENKITKPQNNRTKKELITFEYGAMSSRYQIKAYNKLTAYAAMCLHFGESSHLIILYEPKEIVKRDSWFNPMGAIAVRLDEIFGGQEMFDKYVESHIDDIKQAYITIKEVNNIDS